MYHDQLSLCNEVTCYAPPFIAGPGAFLNKLAFTIEWVQSRTTDFERALRKADPNPGGDGGPSDAFWHWLKTMFQKFAQEALDRKGSPVNETFHMCHGYLSDAWRHRALTPEEDSALTIRLELMEALFYWWLSGGEGTAPLCEANETMQSKPSDEELQKYCETLLHLGAPVFGEARRLILLLTFQNRDFYSLFSDPSFFGLPPHQLPLFLKSYADFIRLRHLLRERYCHPSDPEKL